MLNHVADFYDEDVNLRSSALLSWVEPVILLGVAAPFKDRRPLQLRESAGDDAERLAFGVSVDGRDAHPVRWWIPGHSV